MSASAATATGSPLARLSAAQPALPGGPEWSAWRAAALERLLALGLPTPRDEAWKYVNLRLLQSRELAPAPVRPVPANALEALAPVPGPRLVFVDGRWSPALSTPAAAPPGLTLAPLAGLLAQSSPDALESLVPMPGDAVDERVRLLNAALLGDGLVLGVGPATSVAEPVTLVHVATGPGGGYPRVVVELAASARLTLVEQFVSLGEAESFAAGVTELRLAPGAELVHHRLQLAGPRAILLDDLQAELARDARYVLHVHAFGAQLGRLDARVRLAGPGASTCLYGLFMVDGARQLDLRTVVEHASPRGTSAQVFRGVAGGRGRGSYDGKIVVQPGAQKTDSSQSSRNLLLSPQAELNSRPQLEIYADDVKCAHGATTGALDENMLFYLLSRGLDREAARGLLTFAFAEDVVAKVALPGLRRFVEERVIGRLPEAELIREFI